MASRLVKWLLLLAALCCLLKALFSGAGPWSVGGFFCCGGAWYWLTWRKTRELDGRGPR